MDLRLPPHLRAVSLLHGNRLNITTDGHREYQISLDRLLGNMEGKFDVNGDDFSESAKNVRLLNNVLHATLVTT